MGGALARDAARRLCAEYERIRDVRHAPAGTQPRTSTTRAARTQVNAGGADRRIDDLTE